MTRPTTPNNFLPGEETLLGLKSASDRAAKEYRDYAEAWLKTPAGKARKALDRAESWARLAEASGRDDHRQKAAEQRAEAARLIGILERES